MPNTTFKYEDLAQKLLRRIAVDRLRPGDKFPTEDQLVQEHSLSRITVRRALSILEKNGYVMRRRKLGTVVTRSLETPSEMHLVRGMVAVVMSQTKANREEDHAIASFLRGIENPLTEEGFGVQILGVGGNLAQDRLRLTRLIERGDLEGICAMGQGIEPLRDLLDSVPTVFACTFTPNGSPWVGQDSAEAARTCAAHLLKHGHQNIAMVCGEMVNNSAFATMVAGCRAAFEECGATFNRTMMHCAYEGESLSELVEHVLLGSPRPTAVYSQYWHATAAIAQVAQKLGMRIPDDLSLIGLGQNTLYVPSHVAITAYVPDNEGVGRQAARALVDLADTRTAPTSPIYVPGRLIERDSVAVCKS